MDRAHAAERAADAGGDGLGPALHPEDDVADAAGAEGVPHPLGALHRLALVGQDEEVVLHEEHPRAPLVVLRRDLLGDALGLAEPEGHADLARERGDAAVAALADAAPRGDEEVDREAADDVRIGAPPRRRERVELDDGAAHRPRDDALPLAPDEARDAARRLAAPQAREHLDQRLLGLVADGGVEIGHVAEEVLEAERRDVAAAGEMPSEAARPKRAHQGEVVVDVVLEGHPEADEIRLSPEDRPHGPVEIGAVGVGDDVDLVPGLAGRRGEVLQSEVLLLDGADQHGALRPAHEASASAQLATAAASSPCATTCTACGPGSSGGSQTTTSGASAVTRPPEGCHA